MRATHYRRCRQPMSTINLYILQNMIGGITYCVACRPALNESHVRIMLRVITGIYHDLLILKREFISVLCNLL